MSEQIPVPPFPVSPPCGESNDGQFTMEQNKTKQGKTAQSSIALHGIECNYTVRFHEACDEGCVKRDSLAGMLSWLGLGLGVLGLVFWGYFGMQRIEVPGKLCCGDVPSGPLHILNKLPPHA